MTKTLAEKNTSKHGSRRAGPKLPTLPKGSKIQKRPLAHRIGASPARTVYVSSKAPFMSLVKRVCKKLDHDAGGARLSSTRGLPLLAQMDNLHVRGTSRNVTGVSGEPGDRDGAGGGGGSGTGVDEGKVEQGKEKHEVKVLATGKAIEKALEVAAWFTRQPDCVVAIRTGSVSTVDEVEFPVGRTLGDVEVSKENEKGPTAASSGGDLDMDDEAEDQQQGGAREEELDPYRMRMLTYVEVGVRYRTS